MKLISLFISFCLIFEQPVFAQVARSLDLSAHFANFGKSIAQTDKFRPLHLRYLGYDNLSQGFKLLLDKGDTNYSELLNSPNSSTPKLEQATQELFNYFLIGLALPNDKFWVNLRPDSPDNILDPDLEKTDIGRIFLEADLQLKKDTAQWTSPQTPEGKVYWDKLYKKAGELFGTENITIPTLTRPWIVPNEIIIRESPEGAYIYKATLKVMLEEDYLQSQVTSHKSQVNFEQYTFKDPRMKELNAYSTQLIRETIIPKLTYEVNTSKRYAPLRQVYYSLILAQWFKQRFGKPVSQLAGKPVNWLTGSPANPYIKLIDSRDLTNLIAKEPYDKQAYFQQYQRSFQDGEYNLSEPVWTPLGQSIRRYVSGGIFVSSAIVTEKIVTTNSNYSYGRPYLIRYDAASSAYKAKIVSASSGIEMTNYSNKITEEYNNSLTSALEIYLEEDGEFIKRARASQALKKWSGNKKVNANDFVKFASNLYYHFTFMGDFDSTYEDLIRQVPIFNDPNLKSGFKKMLDFAEQYPLNKDARNFIMYLGKVSCVQWLEYIIEKSGQGGKTIGGNINPNSEANKQPFYDLASGAGAIVYFRNLSSKRKYIFVDKNPFVVAYLNFAKKIMGFPNSMVEVKEADILKLSIPAQSVGTLRLNNIGGYIKTKNIPDSWYEEIKESIVRGGQLIVGYLSDNRASKLAHQPIINKFNEILKNNEWKIEKKEDAVVFTRVAKNMPFTSSAVESNSVEKIASRLIRDMPFAIRKMWFCADRVFWLAQELAKKGFSSGVNAYYFTDKDYDSGDTNYIHYFLRSGNYILDPAIDLNKWAGVVGLEKSGVYLFSKNKLAQEVYGSAKPLPQDEAERLRNSFIAKMASSSMAQNQEESRSLDDSTSNKKGGIDLHALPIQTQQIKSLQSLSASPLSINPNLDFDKEWSQIQAVFNAGVRPSVQRLVEFSAAAAASPTESQRIDDVLDLIADTLRREEEAQNLTPTDPALKGLLSALEV